MSNKKREKIDGGHRPLNFFIEGHRPKAGNPEPKNPPRGGSGVPSFAPKSASRKSDAPKEK